MQPVFQIIGSKWGQVRSICINVIHTFLCLISQTVFDAVQNQASALNEISETVNQIKAAGEDVSFNVQNSAIGIQEISDNTVGFSQSLSEVTHNMKLVKTSTEEIFEMAEKLQESVDAVHF